MLLEKKVWLSLLLSLPLFAAGCGSDRPSSTESRAHADLREIHEIYALFIKQHQKPPTQMSDLTQRQYEGVYPATIQRMQQGKYVIVWGVTEQDSRTLLAYEKDAPTQGGGVLMADGTVKDVTADEFKANYKP